MEVGLKLEHVKISAIYYTYHINWCEKMILKNWFLKNDLDHYDEIQTTTIWLQVLDMVTLLTLVRLYIFITNGVNSVVPLTLLS